MLVYTVKWLCFKNREVLLQLYRVLMRLHLEYSTLAWSPYLKGEITAWRQSGGSPGYSSDEGIVLSRKDRLFGLVFLEV